MFWKNNGVLFALLSSVKLVQKSSKNCQMPNAKWFNFLKGEHGHF